MTEKEIYECIKLVKDPELGHSLEELNAIDKIVFEDNIKIYLKLVQPIYWISPKINELIINELRKLSKTQEFEIIISEKEQIYTNRQSLNGVKNLIAVASGKGGVGKSAVAANLACTLAKKGAKVGLLDADVYGPSQPTIFGVSNAKLGVVKDNDGKTFAKPIKKYNVDIASMGMIMEKMDAAIVRGPMLAGYFSMLFEQVFWGNLDFLIFDLPPGTGDIQLTLCQKIPLTGAVVVTTPQEISVADVRRSISMFNKVNVDVLGVIENMSYFTPPDMPEKKYYIFGEGGGEEVAGEFGVNFLGKIPLDINMRDASDSGMPIAVKEPNSMPSQEFNNISERIVSLVRQRNFVKSSQEDIKISI